VVDLRFLHSKSKKSKIFYKSIGKVKNKFKKDISSVNYELSIYLRHGTINK